MTTPRQYIITLLNEKGFFYIEERLLCYLETFVIEMLARLTFTLEEIGLFICTWLDSILLCVRRNKSEGALFLRLLESDNEIYFTVLTRDARLLSTFSGDSLVETIALAILAMPCIPCE